MLTCISQKARMLMYVTQRAHITIWMKWSWRFLEHSEHFSHSPDLSSRLSKALEASGYVDRGSLSALDVVDVAIPLGQPSRIHGPIRWSLRSSSSSSVSCGRTRSRVSNLTIWTTHFTCVLTSRWTRWTFSLSLQTVQTLVPAAFFFF